LELYVKQRSKGGVPRRIVLDLVATAVPTHGEKEGSYYHGYCKERIYHPLVVFDGDTGQMIGAVLRAGNTHASRGVGAILRRIVTQLRRAWPSVKIELRGDAGFALPSLYEYCEAEGVDYVIGLITNARLRELREALARSSATAVRGRR
jgi:Transposase DDE domain group 1